MRRLFGLMTSLIAAGYSGASLSDTEREEVEEIAADFAGDDGQFTNRMAALEDEIETLQSQARDYELQFSNFENDLRDLEGEYHGHSHY